MLAYDLSRSNGEESDDSDDEETPRAANPSMIKRRDYQTFLSDAFDRIEETSRDLYTEENEGISSLHKGQDLHSEELSQIDELLYTYADSACDLLHSCRPSSRICYKFFYKLINRVIDIRNKFDNLHRRAGNARHPIFSYFDKDLLDVTNVPKRHRTPGCASLYNDQETTPLGPYLQDADDERLTRTIALRIDPNVTRIIPHPLAFPDPIVLSLANSEPINDISSYNIRSTLLSLVAEHNELCDLANHIKVTQTQRELDLFEDDYQYFPQRDDIFGKLVTDQDDTYLNSHIPHGADIRAILSYSITMTLETYPDMPTCPDVPHFVDTFY